MNPDLSAKVDSKSTAEAEPDAFLRLSEEQFSQTLEELADIIKCLGADEPTKSDEKK